ncbi:MAG TPA: LysR family transcriptional regulator [Myxococcales bacterium]|nr:LysR family transcriptional regulator [Myxococcales bacterium]
MDRLDELTALVAILESGSLAAAGRKLRRSPPAMTRLLASLEERVGARLIERNSRRLSPTEAGRRLGEQARQLLTGYGDAVRESSAPEVRGEIRVTAPLVFGRRHVTPIVTSFLELYPQIRVELVLSDHALNLIEEGLDLAVRIGRLGDSSLIARRVGEVRRLSVASPAYLARRGTPRTPADLAKHDLVFTSGNPGPEWRFRRSGRDIAIRPTPRLVVNEVDAMLIAVRAGHGIGRPLSYQVADDLASHSLVRLLPEFEPVPLPVQLVTPSAQRVAPKVRAFADHAARSLATLEVLRR